MIEQFLFDFMRRAGRGRPRKVKPNVIVELKESPRKRGRRPAPLEPSWSYLPMADLRQHFTDREISVEINIKRDMDRARSREWWARNRERMLLKAKRKRARRKYARTSPAFIAAHPSYRVRYLAQRKNERKDSSFLLTIKDTDRLWFRDQAGSMKRPEIALYNPIMPYRLDNCYIKEKKCSPK